MYFMDDIYRLVVIGYSEEYNTQADRSIDANAYMLHSAHCMITIRIPIILTIISISL